MKKLIPDTYNIYQIIIVALVVIIMILIGTIMMLKNNSKEDFSKSSISKLIKSSQVVIGPPIYAKLYGTDVNTYNPDYLADFIKIIYTDIFDKKCPQFNAVNIFTGLTSYIDLLHKAIKLESVVHHDKTITLLNNALAAFCITAQNLINH